MNDRLPQIARESPPLDEIFEAIEDEITAAAGDPSATIEVRDGRRLHRGVGGALYEFRAESRIPFQPETPMEIVFGDARARGAIVAVEDFHMVVHLHEDLGEAIPAALLATSPTFILQRLSDRLRTVASTAELPSGGIPAAIWEPWAAQIDADDESAESAAETLATVDDPALQPNSSQRLAMSMAAGSNLHFIWGPPGTGKTAALAQIARMLADNGERVMVLAHANVAVDVALARVADAFAGTDVLARGGVLRVGHPHLADVRERSEILVDGAVARRRPGLAAEREQLESSRLATARALRRSDGSSERDTLAAQLRKLRARLSDMESEFRREASAAVAEAQVIGITLSRLAISDDVWEWGPDAILLDEASMVSFPWVLLAATRARKRLVVLGDFRQLPPVHLAQTELARRWLGGDAFEFSGVRAAVDAGNDDPRVTLLDTQYRMAEPIAETVSTLAYSGKIRTDPATAAHVVPLAGERPFAGEGLVVVDTSALGSWCRIEARSGSYSRVNPLHVLVAVSLIQQSSVGTAVVTPYRAQARLHASVLEDASREEDTAATVHRYQGSERDAVILDLVDAQPVHGPSRLTGGDVDLALRLVNVGLSRARGKAIVLVDTGLLRDRFASTGPVRRAIDLCTQLGAVVEPRADDVESVLGGSLVQWSTRQADVLESVRRQLDTARESVVFSVPRGMGLNEQLASSLDAAVRRCGSSAVVLGDASVVGPLEHLDCELRLLPLPGLFLSVDAKLVVVGNETLTLAGFCAAPLLESALTASLLGTEPSHKPPALPPAA